MTDTPITGPTDPTPKSAPFSEKINFIDPENLPNPKDIPAEKLKVWEEQKEKFKENFDSDNLPPLLLE